MRTSSAAVAVMLVLSTAVRGSAQVPLPVGVWGGQGIQLTVTADGARIDYGCDSGTIDEPLKAGASGKITARGTHRFGQGGPRGGDDPAAKVHKAMFEGTVEGKSLRLTVLLPELGRTVGEFVLEFGRRAALDRCG